MRKLTAVLAALLVLVGCASVSEAESEPKAVQPVETTAYAEEQTIPDTAGMPLTDALTELSDLNLDVRGQRDRSEINLGTVVLDEWKVERQLPPAGKYSAELKTVTLVLAPLEGTKAAAQAAKEDAKASATWIFECTDGSLFGEDTIEETHYSLKDVWASDNYENFESCAVVAQDETSFKPTKKEKAVIAVVNEHFDGREEDHHAYADALQECAVSRGPANSPEWASAPVPFLKGAALICPKAGHAKEMSAWAEGRKFDDGTYIVGKSITPGTYQVQLPEGADGLHDCYWSRTTPTGDIIANNFIDFSPQGPTVQVYQGEGFVSERCGVWAQVG
ncbi:PASTA domain-containing protein [Arthrobacter crystallopoietes]|uniref:PASTA domain-containing protein n=1 Tax=Crystallibacter crystallopoietes TaxID=37928 RepID=UPI0011110ABA|nr:hypothetical protein [Arthrobacter crystallopoietes]